MKERRKAQRLEELNEITICITSETSEEINIPKNKFLNNNSKDISVSGAKIQSNILLPVDTLLNIDFKIKTLEKEVTALGKVKWINVLVEDKSYLMKREWSLSIHPVKKSGNLNFTSRR